MDAVGGGEEVSNRQRSEQGVILVPFFLLLYCYGNMMGVFENTDMIESVSPALCCGWFWSLDWCSGPNSKLGPKCPCPAPVPCPALTLPFCCSFIGSRNTTCLLVLTLRPGPSVVVGGVGVMMEDCAAVGCPKPYTSRCQNPLFVRP